MTCGRTLEVGGPLDAARLAAIKRRARYLRNAHYGEGETPTLVDVPADGEGLAPAGGVERVELHVACGEHHGVLAVVPYDGDSGGIGAVPECIVHAGRDLLDLVEEVRRLQGALEAAQADQKAYLGILAALAAPWGSPEDPAWGPLGTVLYRASTAKNDATGADLVLEACEMAAEELNIRASTPPPVGSGHEATVTAAKSAEPTELGEVPIRVVPSKHLDGWWVLERADGNAVSDASVESGDPEEWRELALAILRGESYEAGTRCAAYPVHSGYWCFYSPRNSTRAHLAHPVYSDATARQLARQILEMFP